LTLFLYQTLRIDRLSHLPNELLDIIFDLAYARRRSIEPLSKRLLPYHERSLYRRIRFEGSHQAIQLYQSLNLHPSKGSLIKEIYGPLLEYVDEPAEFFQSLTSILPFCLSLEVLEVSPGFDSRTNLSRVSKWNLYAAELLHHLQDLPLKRLEVSLIQKNEEEEAEDEDEEVSYTNLDTLAIIQEHPSICELIIGDWNSEVVEDVRRNRSFTLPGIKSLRIEGIAADKISVKTVTELCPSLLHLHLFSTFEIGVLVFSNVLPHLPISLHSLSLNATRPDDPFCEEHLPRFTSLRSIELGDNMFSSSIHQVLSQLPLLENIKLGYGTLDFDGFSSLIDGSVRLQHLRQVDLNLYPTTIGTQVDLKDLAKIEADGFRLPGEKEGWPKVPEYDHNWREIEQGICAVVEVGKKNGIVVNADISAFEEYRQAFDLEVYNRSVLVAFCQRRPQFIATAQRLARDRSWLPLQADLDSLDPERLELVETPVPELVWFVFSLKNKDEEVAQRDGE
jgi:hypothetical protein